MNTVSTVPHTSNEVILVRYDSARKNTYTSGYNRLQSIQIETHGALLQKHAKKFIACGNSNQFSSSA